MNQHPPNALHSWRAFLCLLILLLIIPCPGRSAALTLAPTEDAYISEYFPPPTGALTELIIGTQGNNGTVDFAANRGLIRFDLSQIPPGATISSVRFMLTVTKAPPGPLADFHLHRLLKQWDGAECSWFLRLDPATWDEPGGAAGTDYAPASSANNPAIGGLGSYTFASMPGLIADVTHWLDQPTNNFGWLIKQRDESIGHTARRVGATGGLAAAPSLEVTYDLASPLRITSVQLQGSQFCLQFEVKAGKSYVVERRESWSPGQWLAITNLPPAATAATAVVCDPLTAGPRFYRVGEQ